MPASPHLLIIDARFYDSIADELLAGATAAIESAAATHDRISVPGVLEIPVALAMAVASNATIYDGFVLLGCVIRGETTHYDIVAEQSARAVMDLAVLNSLALGNGILTVESREQAMVRARRAENDKGGVAARAALDMIALRERFRRQQVADG